MLKFPKDKIKPEIDIEKALGMKNSVLHKMHNMRSTIADQ